MVGCIIYRLEYNIFKRLFKFLDSDSVSPVTSDEEPVADQLSNVDNSKYYRCMIVKEDCMLLIKECYSLIHYSSQNVQLM